MSRQKRSGWMGLRQGSPIRRASDGAVCARRLGFETLEDRRLLAVITVDSSLDNFMDADYFNDGKVTLREAIKAANFNLSVDGSVAGDDINDTIVFAPALSVKTITLNSAELVIRASLTIDATALDENIVIDAQQNSRVLHSSNFSAANTHNLTLVGVTLTGGQMNVGGGIYFRGGSTLTLIDSVVSGNSTTDGEGGGIYFIVLAMGLKPSPLGETFRFFFVSTYSGITNKDGPCRFHLRQPSIASGGERAKRLTSTRTTLT